MSSPSELAQSREAFLGAVAEVRVDLHRYCARLTGSVIEGEDVVQETFAKAFQALSLQAGVPELRPWLFRIAHNTAIDLLRARRRVEVREDFSEVADAEVTDVDPFATSLALSRFVALPLTQRSAVILKDVLGLSLEEAAEVMGTTVLAVKAALVRGRGALREAPAAVPVAERSSSREGQRADLERYATLFNARDWDGLQRMIGEDCRLDLVSKASRRGKEVGQYFGRYRSEDVRVELARLEGEDVLAAYEPADAASPSYFILLTFDAGRVASIRDYRYARHIANEAET